MIVARPYVAAVQLALLAAAGWALVDAQLRIAGLDLLALDRQVPR